MKTHAKLPAAAPALEAEGLGKTYRLYRGTGSRLLELATFGRVRGHTPVVALADVDLSVARGSALGLCGLNGAGKSTLLSILAGTVAPSSGRFRVRGRVASLIELGIGIQPELSGRANLLRNGVLMGIAPRVMRARIDAIIEFSELGERIDDPVRTYSLGMGMRLGFSLATAVDPDVLLIDEVFAVGDLSFQRKCVDRIRAFRADNRAILFCTHSMYELRQLCDEALWLADGRVHLHGGADEVAGRYAAQELGRASDAGAPARDVDRRDLELDHPHLVDVVAVDPATGEPTRSVRGDRDFEIRVQWRNPRPAEHRISLGVGLLQRGQHLVVGLGTHLDGVALEGREGTTVLELRRPDLLPASYLVIVWLMDDSGLHRWDDLVAEGDLQIEHPRSEMGLWIPAHRWRT